MRIGKRYFPLNHINHEENGLNDYIIVITILAIIGLTILVNKL